MQRRYLFLLLLVPLLLFSCKKEGRNFRIEGEFRNMNQAQLFLIDPATGYKDTINVERGRFFYESERQDTTLLLLMFPNFSFMPVFTGQGVSLELKADASHLKEATLKGSDDNDEMTAFRLRVAQMTPPEEIQAAKEFITENPASLVSLFLLRHYFVDVAEPDYHETLRLCRLMVQANPRQQAVLQLYRQLRILNNGAVGNKIPLFAVLDIKNRVLTNEQFRKDVNVFCLWSTWNYESRMLVNAVRKLQKKHPGHISLMAISIDATRQEGADWLRRDTIGDYVVNDGRMWQTPMAKGLGFTTMPSNVIADRHGHILLRNLTKQESLEKEIKKLLPPDTK